MYPCPYAQRGARGTEQTKFFIAEQTGPAAKNENGFSEAPVDSTDSALKASCSLSVEACQRALYVLQDHTSWRDVHGEPRAPEHKCRIPCCDVDSAKVRFV